MPSKTTIIVATSAILVLTLGFGYHNLRSASKTEATLAAFSQKFTRLDASIQREQEQISARQSDATALSAKLKAAQLPKLDAAKNTMRTKDPATLMASDPKLRALFLKGVKAGWSREVLYGSMYQSLGLTQAQIDKFEELATAQADEVVTIHAAALARGLELSDPGLAALEKQSKDQFYAAVAAEVSPEASQQAIQSDRVSGVQSIVVMANILIAPGAPPLTSLQAAQLTQIVADASASFQSGGSANLDDIDWDKVDNQAAALLPSTQLQSFKTAIENQQYSSTMKKYFSQQQGGSP